ncbi:MAG TPA: hypothetical protein VKU85_18210, partial [bacterium]|nr:hypothetical protein [bacterium]
LDRPVWTVRYHVRRLGDAGTATEEMIAKYDLDVILVRPDARPEESLWSYLQRRAGGGGAIEWVGDVAVVRVSRSAAGAAN